MRVPTDPPFSAKVRCVKSIRLDLFLLYTSLFQHPPLFSKSPVCKVNTARPFSFVTKRTFWQHACGHFETWVGGPGAQPSLSPWGTSLYIPPIRDGLSTLCYRSLRKSDIHVTTAALHSCLLIGVKASYSRSAPRPWKNPLSIVYTCMCPIVKIIQVMPCWQSLLEKFRKMIRQWHRSWDWDGGL